MKILITGAFSITPSEQADLTSAGHTLFFQQQEKAPTHNPELYEAVICNALFLYNPIERFTSLRQILLTSAGLDRVPQDYIRTHGIALQNAAGVYSVPMAEFGLCGILQLYKQSAFFLQAKQQHTWQKHRGLMELSGKHAVILGTGSVGQETAKRLQAFGCRVTGINRTARPIQYFDAVLPLTALLPAAQTADILMCALALTDETTGIVSSTVFNALKPGCVFVNVSRGALADESALISWLGSASSGGAVLDVFAEEPLPQDNPLWSFDNVVLTPHNSFVGEGNHERLFSLYKGVLL